MRWIKNDYDYKHSVTDMMTELKLDPLDFRRKINRLTFMYKIVNSKVAVQPDRIDLFYKSRPHRTVCHDPDIRENFKYIKIRLEHLYRNLDKICSKTQFILQFYLQQVKSY